MNFFGERPPNYFSESHNLTLIDKFKIPRPLSQATASNHTNIFTLMLPLSGQEGEA
jgi:hypothetical protein